MNVSRFFGVTLMILGALAFTFFGALVLTNSVVENYFPSEGNILPSELNDVLSQFLSIDPLKTPDATAPTPLTELFGYQILTGMSNSGDSFPSTPQELLDFAFAISVAWTLLGFGLLLGTIGSIFNGAALGITFFITFLVVALLMVGGTFYNLQFTDYGLTQLPGAATLASPLFAIMLGSFFMMVFFGLRRKRRK